MKSFDASPLIFVSGRTAMTGNAAAATSVGFPPFNVDMA